MQFLGTIDKKGLSWVVRAADFNNYYAIRLTVLKPGPVPAIGVTRYAVIHGKAQNPSHDAAANERAAGHGLPRKPRRTRRSL